MLEVVLVILVLLWALGYLRLPGLVFPSIGLFSLNGHLITLWDVLILLVLAWVIGALPSPLREVAAIFLLLWVISTLGFLVIAGLSNLIIIAFIVGLLLYLLRGVA